MCRAHHRLMLLSIVIPARDEAGCLEPTVNGLVEHLRSEDIPFEVVIVDDGSSDGTYDVACGLVASCPEVHPVRNSGRHGFGCAIAFGIGRSRGEAVAIFMADSSDSPEDLVTYYRKLDEGYECVFGSRFMRGGKVIDYPPHKLLLNRMANYFIGLLFGIRFYDTTNAFKCYRRNVIEGLQPLISCHFNLTVEMPLKAIIRGYSYAVVPITWRNRAVGVSKLKIQEMGSRYLFIVLYLWLEKHLSRNDYNRRTDSEVLPSERGFEERKNA